MCALFVYLYICRVNNLAAPQRNIQAVKPYYMIYGKKRQDKQQNVNMPRNYNRPNFPYLSEITTIKFNTGVSMLFFLIFTLI